MTLRKSKDELEFDAAFDERGQLREGITRLRVPIKMIDSAGDLPKGVDYCVRVSADIALARLPGFVARDGNSLKCVPDRKPASRTPKFVDTNLDWLSDDSERNAIKDAGYERYDADLRDAWRRTK